MSGRFASSSSAAISASSRCSAASSAAGAISTSSTSPSERCVNVENQRSDSISTSNMSTLHRALLGRGEHVQQTPAQRELPALLDLLDAFVAGRDELRGAFVEVEQLAHAQRERVRAQRRVGHLLRQRHRADDDDRRLGLGRLSRPAARRAPPRAGPPDAAAAQVRLVRHAPRGVVAHAPRRQPGAQVRGHVARRAIVAHDHQRRARPLGRAAVRERRDRVGPQRGGHERVAALARQALRRLRLPRSAPAASAAPSSTRALPASTLLDRRHARARSARRPRPCVWRQRPST